MLAIPLAIIAFSIWYVRFCYHTYQYTKYDTQESISMQKADAVKAKYTDQFLEERIYSRLDKDYATQFALIGDLMGADKVWLEFFRGCGIDISQMILLARHGKIHSFYLYGGNMIPHWPEYNGDAKEIAALQEKFALRLEDELHRHGANDLRIAFYTQDEYSAARAVPLREFVERFGYGHTLRTTRFTFIMKG